MTHFLQGPRPAATAIVTAVNWTANLAVGLTFPLIAESSIGKSTGRLWLCDPQYYLQYFSLFILFRQLLFRAFRGDRAGPLCLPLCLLARDQGEGGGGRGRGAEDGRICQEEEVVEEMKSVLS